jgi:uncharacterized protein (TIGR03086 family)
VVGVGRDQWDLPTPCDDWNVRELVSHIVSGNLWVGALGSGKTIAEVGDELDDDPLGTDPVAAYDRSAAVADGTFRAPGALEAPFAVSYGPVPGSVYAGHRFIDVLIHGWDLATATDQDARLDPDLVAACLEVAEPQAAMLTGSGAYGTQVEVPPDVGAQTRLLALLGRTG